MKIASSSYTTSYSEAFSARQREHTCIGLSSDDEMKRVAARLGANCELLGRSFHIEGPILAKHGIGSVQS